ncbi:MAG: class I SAM-dependent methyltransferase, partial [bacterium]
MATSEEHYSNLLGPVYAWMAGGPSHAFSTGAADLEGYLPAASFAIDLGCGFGMHAVPLARAGWTVLGIDSSSILIDELREHAVDLPVTATVGDLVEFTAHLSSEQRPDLIICMGDTLTHLPAWQSVSQLAKRIASTLSPNGRFVATFRDYTRLPQGPARFIPVRADDDRVLTCFLEEHPDHVEVHDLLHARKDKQWALSVSSYRKLRLRPTDVLAEFE